MDPVVREVSILGALEDLGEVDRRQRRLRRRRDVIVVVVFGKGVLKDHVSGDFFDFVEAALDRIPERPLRRCGRRRWRRRRRR